MIKAFTIIITVCTFATAAELFTTSDSDMCKRLCIDENNHFCPFPSGESGICCDESTNCKNYDFCSFNAPMENEALKYWACPHDPSYCGLEYQLVPQYGIAEFIKPQGDYGS